MKSYTSLKLLVMFIVSLIAVNIAAANLNITEVEVRVDGDTSTLNYDGESFGDVKPESDVSFDVEVKNNLAELEMENIEIRVTIVGIDDDDDMEEEADDFDLRAGRTKSKKLSFDIPLRIDDGDYDVIVEIEGEDENNTQYEITWTFVLSVEKENHELRLFNAMDREEYECGQQGRLEVELLNLGEDEEDTVVFEATADDLGINVRDEEIEVSADLLDDDSSYFKTILFNVPEDLETGIYRIVTKAYYNRNKLSDQEIIEVSVICPEPTTTTTLPPPTTTTLPPVEEDESAAETEEEQQSYEPMPTAAVVATEPTSTSGTTVLLIVLIVLVVITLGVLLAVMLMKKE